MTNLLELGWDVGLVGILMSGKRGSKSSHKIGKAEQDNARALVYGSFTCKFQWIRLKTLGYFGNYKLEHSEKLTMPELSEVAFACKIWNPGLGRKIIEAISHKKSLVYRELERSVLPKELKDATLTHSATHGKQMLFGFSGGRWMGLHLGMSGRLSVETADYEPAKHDALLLRQPGHTLVFQDPRQFGKLTFDKCDSEPEWWLALPPLMTSKEFTLELFSSALERHKRQPIKALLLDQRYFPGMGNWMADEVLWRARIHPAQRAGQISKARRKQLHQQAVFVAQGALDSVGRYGGDPPEGWLFHVRWNDGQYCPKTGEPLVREKIGGRTTCWSPGLQKMDGKPG